MLGLDGIDLLGEIDAVTAVSAGIEMREHLLLLVVGQRMVGEGAELLRVWMVSGLEEVVHLVAGCWLRVVACLLDGAGSTMDRGSVFCRIARILTSRSRGSVPSASSAASLLRPPAWR